MKFDWIYDDFRKSIEKAFGIFTISLSMITILQCFIVHGQFDAEYLLHPHRIRYIHMKDLKKKGKFLTLLDFVHTRLPWDQTTPIGYFGEICIALLHGQMILAVDNQVLLIFVFLCKNNFAFTEMFANFIDQFGRIHGMQQKCDSIRKLVDFHNDIKRFVKFKSTAEFV